VYAFIFYYFLFKECVCTTCTIAVKNKCWYKEGSGAVESLISPNSGSRQTVAQKNWHILFFYALTWQIFKLISLSESGEHL